MSIPTHRQDPMTTTPAVPRTLHDLSRLDMPKLRILHEQGTCPDLDQLQGAMPGRVLFPRSSVLGRFWRGKIFDGKEGLPGGMNRVGLGPLELKRYRFVARVGTSQFSDRQVLLLDHDRPENPKWVRIFHDELVQVGPGLYLATSHLRLRGLLKFVSYFSLTNGAIDA